MNKKITALLLAAALTVGVGSYGTYAYFSDDANLENKVNITMGVLDINARWHGDWKVTSVGNEAKQKLFDSHEEASVEESKLFDPTTNDNLAYWNVKPGDYFTRKVTIENIGSLIADVNATVNNPFDNIFDMEVKMNGEKVDYNNIEMKNVKPLSTNVLEIKLTVKPELNNDFQNKTFKNLNVNDFVTVHAEQLK